MLEHIDMKQIKGLAQFDKVFKDDDACRAYLEARRWPDGPVCPHQFCQGFEGAYKITGRDGRNGKKARPGLYTCKLCRRQFTVTVGTIFANTKLPLTIWFKAMYLMSASKKGVSAHQLHRMLGIPYKTAWNMCQKIRKAKKRTVDQGLLSGVVEIDETYLGGKVRYQRGRKKGEGPKLKMRNKTIVMVAVERGGRAKARPVNATTKQKMKWAIDHSVDTQTHSVVMTDENNVYPGLLKRHTHRTVNHSLREYAKRDGSHINTAESFFALLKRGYHGTYHHFSKKWTGRYCGEFGFRWNTRKVSDAERFAAIFEGI